MFPGKEITMNSTQTLIVALLQEKHQDAMAETERIMSDPNFDPEEAEQALERAVMLRKAREEVERMVIPFV